MSLPVLLNSTGSADYFRLADQDPDLFGVLVTPRTRGVRQCIQDGITWAMDNDAFSGFDAEAFLEQLHRYRPYLDTCRFATCPDVVANHAATLELWREWAPIIREMGYPVAFAAQDGCTIDTVPWSQLDALFVGGSDEFKDRQSAPIIRRAVDLEIWTHLGRANTPRRWRYAAELGMHSFDGNTFTRAPRKELAYYRRWLNTYRRQRRLL